MALVGVVDVRFRRAAQPRPGPQRPHAADAKQQLLLEAPVAAAAVQRLGHPTGDLVVAGHVRVQQQQRDPADLRPPHVGLEQPAARQVQLDHARAAVGLAQQRQRQPVRVKDGVLLLLPPLPVERLAEVTGLVEQTHPDDGHAQVGRGLEMVAGQDAQTSGVLRQDVGEPELGAEVADGLGGARPGHPPDPAVLLGCPPLVPAVLGEVVGQRVGGVLQPRDELGVPRQPLQLLGREPGEQPGRVLPDLVPQDWVDAAEQVAGPGMPGPVQVEGQLPERGNGCGQNGADVEPTDGLHRPDYRACTDGHGAEEVQAVRTE